MRVAAAALASFSVVLLAHGTAGAHRPPPPHSLNTQRGNRTLTAHHARLAL
jgi:hypothetical protein